MKESCYQWRAKDGLDLRGQCRDPEKATKGVVCLVHGFGEHTGRYHHVALQITGAGYAILAFDLRGHGRSGGQRGHAPSYQVLLDDIDLLLEEARRLYPGLPLFLYGHSMGGNLVLNYTLRRKPRIMGVVAASPWLRLAKNPPYALMIAGRVLNRLMPSFSQPSHLDARGLSHDPEVVRHYDSDPLVNRMISTRLFFSIHHAGLWALEHAGEFPLPLLIMHGGADPVTSPGASNQFARRVKGDCTIKIWDGLYHELHNEPQKHEIIQFIVNWLDDHII